MAPKIFRFPRKPSWWLIAALVILLVVVTAFIQPSNDFQEGATGSQTTNAISGVNPSGNIYTMVNTVTEPDGTIVTDTLDTEGNYVTTVYTSNTMNLNQNTTSPSSSDNTDKQHPFTEIKQPRATFQE